DDAEPLAVVQLPLPERDAEVARGAVVVARLLGVAAPDVAGTGLGRLLGADLHGEVVQLNVEASGGHDVPEQLVAGGAVGTGGARTQQALDRVDDRVVVGAGDLLVLVADEQLDDAGLALDA